mmetsp:Transcript_35750/g.47175  ORF Transcript_35750/g.47175 Transcript_35750/m.47175 type:complete len:154 (-) Transcript_35750:274-735(-)
MKLLLIIAAIAAFFSASEAFMHGSNLNKVTLPQSQVQIRSQVVASTSSRFAPALAYRGQQIRKRRGAASLQMQLFGLSAPEIAVCIAVAALILGPDKLMNSARDLGKIAGELKEVPKEFQSGMEEGKAQAIEQSKKKMKPAATEEVKDAEESK